MTENPIPEHLTISPESAWPNERLTIQQQKVIKAVFTLNEDGTDSFFPNIESQASFAIDVSVKNRLAAKYPNNPDKATTELIKKYRGKLRELKWGLDQNTIHDNRRVYENYIRGYLEVEQEFTDPILKISDIRDLVYYNGEYLSLTFKDIIERRKRPADPNDP